MRLGGGALGEFISNAATTFDDAPFDLLLAAASALAFASASALAFFSASSLAFASASALAFASAAAFASAGEDGGGGRGRLLAASALFSAGGGGGRGRLLPAGALFMEVLFFVGIDKLPLPLPVF